MMGVGAALLLNQPLIGLDAGAVGYETLGLAGALAVIIAGWTTSNPTLYRAGLAFQAVTPNWPRTYVTLAVGAVTTLIACLPFVFTGLLDFVGIYGLLLVPAGAIVMTEHWIFPRIGLTRYWASKRALNGPALTAWILSIAFALVMERTGRLHLFYLFLPVYALTSVSYVVLAALAGAKEGSEEREEGRAETVPGRPHERRTLPWIPGVVALAALAACLVMALRVLFGTDYAEDLAWFKQWLIVPTLVYFIAGTVFHLRRKVVQP
jgi:NCS1 family nucleobase:cation symporter-1